jgi:FkbM family methyltransferase
MPRLPQMPVDGMVDVGTPYGGYLLPADNIGRGWLCYCIGTGADISFELELIRRWEARVRSFEAVPHFVEHLHSVVAGEPGLTLEHAALASSDGPLRMQVTHVPGSRSVSAAGLYASDSYIEVPGRTLHSLMAEHGDSRLDLLKMDVEGLEYELLPTLDLNSLGVKVLCVQLHHTATVRHAKRLIGLLQTAGYELIGCRPMVKLTFAHRTLIHASEAA